VKELDEVASMQKQIMLRAASIALTLGVFAIFFDRWPQALGVMAGCFLAVLNFRLLALGIIGIVELETPRAAQVQAVVRYTIRYAIMIGFLYLASINPNLDLFASVVGLILIKVAILGGVIIPAMKELVQHVLNPAQWERGEK
jgi:hypothetical protein